VSHVSEVVDALGPGVPAHVVIPHLNQVLREDLEPEFGLSGVGGVVVGVNLAGDGLGVEGLAVDEGTVADVEVQVRQGHRQQTAKK